MTALAIVDEGRSLTRHPDGYELVFEDLGTAIDAKRLRWEHGELKGMLSVRSRLKGIRTTTGIVTSLRVNLSSATGRKSFVTACRERTAEGVDLDWGALVDEFAILVLAAEQQGRPFTAVGRLPARDDPGYVIRPMFPSGRPAFVYGPPAATKGFLAVALCVSVETGVEVIPGLIPKKGRSLYLDWESDDWDIDDRVKKVAAGAGITTKPQIGYRECIGPLNDQIEDIVREVQKAGVTFIVIDSVGMALSVSREGGDANESTIRMFQALRPLLAAGVTVVLIDHVTGSEIGTTRRSTKPYGSVYKLALARNTFEVRPLKPKEGEEHIRHVVIRHRKANSSSYLPDMGFALTFEPGAVSFSQEEVKPPEEDEDESNESKWPTSTRVRIRKLLEAGHRTPAELATELDVEPATIARVLRRYGPKAKKAEARWFNPLASGKYENLPVADEVIARAATLAASPAPEPADDLLEEPDDGGLLDGLD